MQGRLEMKRGPINVPRYVQNSKQVTEMEQTTEVNRCLLQPKKRHHSLCIHRYCVFLPMMKAGGYNWGASVWVAIGGEQET